MNKYQALFFTISLLVHSSSFASSGGSSGGFIYTINELPVFAKLILFGGGSIASVSLGNRFVEKCEKDMTKRQKSGVKAAGYAGATALFSTMAVEGVKTSMPLIQKNGFSIINHANSADMIAILFTIASIMATIYYADKSLENASDAYQNKTSKVKN